MRVALVHDWLTGMRGGEKVLEVLCEIFPDADIFTLVYKKGTASPIIEKHRIYESFINRFPFAHKIYRFYLPFYPAAVEKFDLRGYDLVISSSHAVAKGVITPPNAFHIAYIHTPMRYVWDHYYEYFSKAQAGTLKRAIVAVFANYIRTWDVASSVRVDKMIANSKFVARRIKKYYGRDADVISPPVDLEKFKPGGVRKDFYLMVSALVPYKKVDLAIKAFNENGRKLKIVGEGPEDEILNKLAKENVELLGFKSDEEIARLYQEARGFVFPGEEDFGITPLEAQASGTPVLAYRSGGALETIQEGVGGVFFDEQMVESLNTGLKKLENTKWNSKSMVGNMKRFSRKKFKAEMKDYILRNYTKFKNENRN